MEKTVRCTVCTWRGAWDLAESVRPPPPSRLPGAMMQVQHDLEEQQQLRALRGSRRPPACPMCGHHTVEVAAQSIRPAT